MSADSRAGRPGAAGRVLVIEDDLGVIRVVERSLRAAGFETLAALEGKEGIALAQSRQPDLVLCDIGLPGMNGYQVAQAVRRLARVPLLVAITGYGHADDVGLAARSGFDHYLVKPVDPAAVLELLARS